MRAFSGEVVRFAVENAIMQGRLERNTIPLDRIPLQTQTHIARATRITRAMDIQR